MDARIESLHVYPVKGARGIDLAQADVGVTGLSTRGVGDREWMIVDGDGQFISQRSHRDLARVTTMVRDDALVLGLPGAGEVAVPLAAPPRDARDVTVWRSQPRAFDEGDAAANAISAFLGSPLRLVRFDDRSPRPCNPDYVGDSGAHTRFADGYPVLVIGAESLHDLNARLAGNGRSGVPMNRFRPNVVVRGLDAYDEDFVDTLVAGAVALKMVKACIRCEVPTIDQQTGIAGDEPSLTLSAYRQHATLGGIAFGVNAIVAAGAGSRLAVGMPAVSTLAF